MRLREAIVEHLGTTQVTRVIYGSIIGLALVVALEHHPPGAGTVAALLVGTGISVGLAELYSEIIGTQVRRRRRAENVEWHHMLDDAVAVTYGVSFPAVFFVLAGLDVLEDHSAFTIAKWSGLGLIAFYGFCAGRLAGETALRALGQAFLVGLVAGALIALKALLH